MILKNFPYWLRFAIVFMFLAFLSTIIYPFAFPLFSPLENGELVTAPLSILGGAGSFISWELGITKPCFYNCDPGWDNRINTNQRTERIIETIINAGLFFVIGAIVGLIYSLIRRLFKK